MNRLFMLLNKALTLTFVGVKMKVEKNYIMGGCDKIQANNSETATRYKPLFISCNCIQGIFYVWRKMHHN